MKKTKAAKPKAKKDKDSGLGLGSVAKIQIELRGWFFRVLNVDRTGEYGKLRGAVEFFLTRAGQELNALLWDRATDVAVEEALRHLVLQWGPRFKEAIELDIRIGDTHVQFSITVPADSITLKRRTPLRTTIRTTELQNAEKSLYVVRCLMDRLRCDPSGRQLVFRRLIQPLPSFLMDQ